MAPNSRINVIDRQQATTTQVSAGQDRIEAQAESSLNTYEYQSLPPGHIRCLIIYPGPQDSNIEVSLFNFSLHDDPRGLLRIMEALSYTWGAPTPAKSIRCRHEPGKVFVVSPNLHDALVGLRQPDDSLGGGRFMWIDQLCINQNDNEEKSKQVQLMGAIYSKASQVVIWLSKEVFHLKNLSYHLDQFLELWRTSAKLKAAEEAFVDEGLAVAMERIPQLSWDVVRIIYGQTYFTRVWMIQEVVMAKQCYVLVEDGLIEWLTIRTIGETLSTASANMGIVPLPVQMRKPLRCLQKMSTLRQRLVDVPRLGQLRTVLASSLSDPNRDLADKLMLARAIEYSETRRWSLLDLVQKAWEFNATDLRDKIYALLGLLAFDQCCLGSLAQLYPDYSSQQTYQHLLQDVTTTSFIRHRSLSTLTFCHPSRNIDLPSWLLDVEDPHATDMRYDLGRELWSFSASGSEVAAVLANLNDTSVLDFKVTRIGTIFRLAPVSVDEVSEANLERRRKQEFSLQLRLTPKHLIEIIRTCFWTAIDAENRDVTPDDSWLEPLFRMIMCDTAPDGQRLPVAAGELQLPAFKVLIEGSEEREELKKLVAGSLLEYFAPALRRVLSMRFCSGEQLTPMVKGIEDNTAISGLLCWAPKEVEVGDLVAVVHGFPLPMLMRRVAGSNRYRFLSICYAQGFMDGEALERPGCEWEYIMVC